MTPQLTQLLVFVGVIAGVFGLIWAAQNAARKRGEAEAKLEAESEARKAEQEMTDVTMQPRDPSQPRSSMEDGSF